ncbi:c-type cytochrome [Aequorivita capsosiphonis]|uniref:c-type cytochrome n=1 Tax=Aequorivita capsosiphonis TaxID=487317 RepID=UPI0003FC16C6|nr:c-type cytochrome [Aequorivita capsosiphonis]
MKTQKKLITLFSAIGILMMVLGLYAFTTNPIADESYSPQPPWENLKVLPKDISKDSLDHLMKGYTLALGVKCNHCHAPSKTDPTKLDFPSDAKIEKEIARGMITMTDEINEKSFKPYFPKPIPHQVYVVNCVMCHRGNVNPEKYLSQMGDMYKTYDPNRDNRKEKILESGEWKE